jgi:hypothetical protein
MSAVLMKLPDNIINFKLPKKPKVVEKEDQPYQKQYSITPYRAAADKRLHEGTLRVLMTLCSYTNRAGITWVGITAIGKELGISKQAVSKQMKLLESLGYVQVVSKGFRAERANTRRVIFDPSLTTEDVIAVAGSAEEDVRPPFMVKQEEKEMDELARKRMVEQAMELSKGFGKANVFKVNTEPKPTDSITVREMKMKIAEHKEKVKRVSKAKREKLSNDADELLKQVEKLVVKPVDNLSHSQLHSQPDSQLLEVDQRDLEGIYKDNNNKVLSNKLINIYKIKVSLINKIERVLTTEDQEVMLSMVEAGLDEVMWTMIVEDTLNECQRTRKEPPHRIAYFKEAIMRTLNTSLA